MQLLIVPPLIVNTQSFPISTAPPSPSSSLQFAMILLSKISVPLDTEKPQFLFWPSMVPSVPLSFIVSVLPSYTQNISSSVALQVKVYPLIVTTVRQVQIGAIKYRPTLPIVLRPRRRRQQRQAQAQGRQKAENTFFHIIPPSKRLVHPSDAPRGYPLAEIYCSVRASKSFSACWTVVRMMPAAMVCRSSCKTAALTPADALVAHCRA